MRFSSIIFISVSVSGCGIGPNLTDDLLLHGGEGAGVQHTPAAGRGGSAPLQRAVGRRGGRVVGEGDSGGTVAGEGCVSAAVRGGGGGGGPRL